MRLVYVGPFRPGVTIPLLDIDAEHGVPFDVDDPAAGDALLAQGTFALPDSPAGRAAIAEASARASSAPAEPEPDQAVDDGTDPEV